MKHLAVITCAALVALVAAGAARASTDVPLLDQVASSIAGKSELVYCSTAWTEWYGWLAPYQATFPDAEWVEGFNYGASAPGVYVNPKVCEALRLVAAGYYQDAGSYYASEAVGTLIHEAYEQAGGGSYGADDGPVECYVLDNLQPVLTQDFGVPATISKTVTRVTHHRRHGRLVFRVLRRTVQVANPWLAKVQAWAEWWHQQRPYPAYHDGSCG